MSFNEESRNLANNFLTQLQEALNQLDKQEIQESGLTTSIFLAATRYKKVMEHYEQLLLSFEKILKKQKDMRHQHLRETHIEIYNKYEIAKKTFLASAIPQKIYNETFLFQNILNQNLNQTMKTVMVIDGELYDISNLPIEQYLGFGYSSRGKLVGRYGQLISSKVQNIANQLEIKDENMAEASEVKKVYQEANSRYKYSKQFRGKSKNIIWWNTQKRGAVKVSSAGSIDEAYANFRISRNTNWVTGKNLEEKIKYFSEEGILKVTNLSGMLQGDVSVKNTEYAIKSIGASTLGLEQLKALAKDIADEGQTFSKKSLQHIRDSQKGFEINTIASFINKTSTKLIDEYKII